MAGFGSGSPLTSFGILKDLIGFYTHILKISFNEILWDLTVSWNI